MNAPHPKLPGFTDTLMDECVRLYTLDLIEQGAKPEDAAEMASVLPEDLAAFERVGNLAVVRGWHRRAKMSLYPPKDDRHLHAVPDPAPTTPADVPTAPSSLKFHDAAELMEADLAPADWRLPGFVADGVISIFGGYTGAGKTPITVGGVIAALLTGRDFAGLVPPDEQHRPLVPPDYKVVYLTQESEHTFRPLLYQFGLKGAIKSGQLEVVYAYEAFALGMDWDDLVAAAAARVGTCGLLVIDPLSDWAGVRDEDDNAVMTEAFRPVVIAAGRGIGVWVIAHTWKSFDKVADEDADVMHIRGGGAIVSNGTVIWTYKKPSPKVEDGNVRHMKQVRNRFGNDGKVPETYLRLTDDGRFEAVNDVRVKVERERLDWRAVLTTAEEAGAVGVRLKELDDVVGKNERTGIVKQLLRMELLSESGVKQSKTDPYHLHITPKGSTWLREDESEAGDETNILSREGEETPKPVQDSNGEPS